MVTHYSYMRYMGRLSSQAYNPLLGAGMGWSRTKARLNKKFSNLLDDFESSLDEIGSLMSPERLIVDLLQLDSAKKCLVYHLEYMERHLSVTMFAGDVAFAAADWSWQRPLKHVCSVGDGYRLTYLVRKWMDKEKKRLFDTEAWKMLQSEYDVKLMDLPLRINDFSSMIDVSEIDSIVGSPR